MEHCDWWKGKHLFNSFIHRNSSESHDREQVYKGMTIGRAVREKTRLQNGGLTSQWWLLVCLLTVEHLKPESEGHT